MKNSTSIRLYSVSTFNSLTEIWNDFIDVVDARDTELFPVIYSPLLWTKPVQKQWENWLQRPGKSFPLLSCISVRRLVFALCASTSSRAIHHAFKRCSTETELPCQPCPYVLQTCLARRHMIFISNLVSWMLAARLRFGKTICPTWHGPFSSETQDAFFQDVVSVGATAMRNMFELLVLLMQLRRTGMEILMGNLGSKGLLVETCGIRESIIETYWNWKPRKPRKPIPKIIAGWKYGAAKWPRWPSQFTPIPYFSITSHTSHTSHVSTRMSQCLQLGSNGHTAVNRANPGFTTMFVNVRASWPSMTFRFSWNDVSLQCWCDADGVISIFS